LNQRLAEENFGVVNQIWFTVFVCWFEKEMLVFQTEVPDRPLQTAIGVVGQKNTPNHDPQRGLGLTHLKNLTAPPVTSCCPCHLSCYPAGQPCHRYNSWSTYIYGA
jgi:hypothetical protein